MRKTYLGLAASALLSACGGPAEKAADGTAAPPSGERLFSACAVCHVAASPETPAGKMKLVGPSLWGVAGRAAASVPEFKYSRAMQNAALTWDDATLSAYLENPHKVVPGTLMSYAGEPDAAKRAALIEYLKTLK
jgi:cytochrome c